MLGPPASAVTGDYEIRCQLGEAGDRVGNNRFEKTSSEVQPTDEGMNVIDAGYSLDMLEDVDRP